MKKTTDFLIIGGGIIGLSIARQLQHMHNPCSITIIEKEQNLGEHASGRNSGVLHSGVYYPADSLKARFTKDGNKKWQNYCEEKNLFLDKCGKLIIATSENELEGLDIIEQRALENAVEIERLDSKQASEIEPRAKTFQSALFVPSTATINPKEINESMASDFQANGGEILLDCSYIKKVKDNTFLRQLLGNFGRVDIPTAFGNN